MIETIQFENFRGQSEKYDLQDLQLITGKNGAGKTTILKSIEFALKGTIGNTRTNAEIHSKYVSAEVCTVILKTTQGDLITRVISEKKKLDKNTGQYAYVYSQDLEIDGHQKITGIRKAQEYIDTILNVPGVAFNFSEFREMTSTGRREFFLGLVTFTEMDRLEIIDYLKLSLLNDEMDDEYKKIIESSIEEMEFDTLEKAIEWADHAYKKYNRQKTVDKNAAIKLNQLKNELHGNVKKISQLEDDVESLNKDKEENIQQLQHTKSTLREIENDKTRLDKLEFEKATLLNTDYDQSIKKLQNEIIDLNKKDAKLKTTDVADLQEQRELLSKELALTTTKFEELNRNLKTSHSESVKIVDHVKKMQNDIDKMDKIICPIINQICPSSEELKEIYKKEIISEKEKLGPLQKEIDKILEELSFVDLELESIKRRVLETTTLVKDTKHKNLEIKRIVEETLNNIRITEKQLSDVIAKKQTKEAVIKSLEEQIKNIGDKAYEDYEDVEDLEGIREGIDLDLRKLKEELETLNKKQRDMQNQSRTLEDGRRSELKFQAISIIKTRLGPIGLQGDIIKNNLSEISDELTELIHAFGKEEIFYFNTITKQGKEDFSFGWIRENIKINFESLSRGEQMITTAAMLIIFLKRMNSALKLILLDEINNLDDLNLDNIFAGFSKLEHEQVIIAGVLNTEDINIGNFKEVKI